MSSKIENKVFCMNEAPVFQDLLKAPNAPANCSDRIDEGGLYLQLKTKCHGKNKCEIKIDDLYAYTQSVSADHECGDDALFFLQAPCNIDPDTVNMRQVGGLVGASLAVLIYLFTVVYFDYIKSVQKNKFVDFDVKTITAGDYTIEFDIDEEVYENFEKNYYDETNPMSEAAQFKLYVQLELEQRISDFPNLGVDGDEDKPIKIAQITFAYHNATVINWLKKRGTFVKTEKWDKLDDINETIASNLREDKHLLDQMQRPCSVFATFETEEGYSRACLYNDHVQEENYKHYDKFLGSEIELQEASEPTDIIWENRAFKPFQRTIKRVIVTICILIMLAISASIIFKCSLESNKRKFRYPIVDCHDFAKQYGCANGECSDLKSWKTDAKNEYRYNKHLQMKDKQTHYTGGMQCLCTSMSEFDKKNKNTELIDGYTTTMDGKEVKICDDYISDKLQAKILGQSIAFIIIAVNIILKTVIIKLITWIGEDTVSERLASITNGVFYAQFFNTGFLLLMVNANMSEHSPHFFTKFFRGTYHDYMPAWYADVGQKITQTMLINSILPYVTLTTSFIIPKIKRALDNKFSGNPYKTKKTSMALFKQVYSGADYTLHFKYSGVLNIVYISMMYGLGMPILFPLAAFNFMNQFICERTIAAWGVKLPAALDDKLTNNALNMLKWAPILFLFNGYWMVSNRQMFENTWNYITDVEHTMKSSHQIVFGVNWAAPTLFMAVASVALVIVQRVFADYLMKWGFAMSSQEIKVDEDLPNFFKSVKLSHADELIEENNNMKENFKFMPNDPDTIHVLDATKIPKKAIQGTPWYQILSNPEYATHFQYIGAYINEREKLIEDGYPETENAQFAEEERQIRFEQSDMVVLLLNLAYIPDSVI
mmetsp:Transcript_5223/g.8085  ORF Transcript_5223/g.8085 Transcript_5223/m.8085 type:complete len:884 (-) Transcript_5223:266-2917(-)